MHKLLLNRVCTSVFLAIAMFAQHALARPTRTRAQQLSRTDSTRVVTADGRWVAFNEGRSIAFFDTTRNTVARRVSGQITGEAMWTSDSARLAVSDWGDEGHKVGVIDRQTGVVTIVEPESDDLFRLLGVATPTSTFLPQGDHLAIVRTNDGAVQYQSASTAGHHVDSMRGFVSTDPSGARTHAYYRVIDDLHRTTEAVWVELATGRAVRWFDASSAGETMNRLELLPDRRTLCLYGDHGLYCTRVGEDTRFHVDTPVAIPWTFDNWRFGDGLIAYWDRNKQWYVHDLTTGKTKLLRSATKDSRMILLLGDFAYFYRIEGKDIDHLSSRVYEYALSTGKTRDLFVDERQPGPGTAVGRRTDEFLMTRSNPSGGGFELMLVHLR